MDTIVFLLILAALTSMRTSRRCLSLALFLAALVATLLVFRHHVTDPLPLSFQREAFMTHRLGWWLAHFNILAVCAVLAGAFGVQFVEGELPCPLCVLQRMAMLLCALGPAFIILKLHDGQVEPTDFATGYGLSVLAAVSGAAIAGRQVLLHIVPPDPGYGDPVLGLHLYTWSFIVFVVVLIVSAGNLIFVRALVPRDCAKGWASTAVIGVLAAVIVANAVTVFAEEGLHWTLPDNPTRYRLFDDLGWQRAGEAP